MISQIKQKGFTIVELLIVIVVIAILAALSYVGYTSIAARANNSTAMASAKAVKDAAQVYQTANSGYPTSAALLRNGGTDAIAKLPSDILFVTNATNAYGATLATAGAAVQANTATTAGKSVTVYPCGTTGLRIFYKDFSGSTAKYMDAGDCTSAPGSAVAAFTN